MNGLLEKILEACERVANIFLHPGANYTYMYNLHTVCKSAHVNGALLYGKQMKSKSRDQLYLWMIFIYVHLNQLGLPKGPTMTLNKYISRRTGTPWNVDLL